MTNKNKKTKTLVASSDEESLDTDFSDPLRNLSQNFNSECEVDAQTFDLDDINGEMSGRSRADLKNALKIQARAIQEFEFEMEQLRGRHRGLEEELKARIEITENINTELSDSLCQLGEARQKLMTHKVETRTTQTALLNANKSIARLTDKSKGLKSSSVDLKRNIRSLEAKLKSSEKTVSGLQKDRRDQQKPPVNLPARTAKPSQTSAAIESQLRVALSELHDLRYYVNGRKNDWQMMEKALSESREQLETELSQSEALNRELDERNTQLLRSREQCIDVSDKFSKQKTRSRKLSQENRALGRTLEHDVKIQISHCRTTIDEQAGEIAAQSQEIVRLRKDNSRIELYSDALRIQFQDYVSTTRDSVTKRHNLEAGLEAANAMITKLRKQLEAEQVCNVEQSELIEKQREGFELEARQIRFELGAAEETLTGQQILNDKLACDLVETQGFRKELESLLTESANESENSLTELSAQLAQVKLELSDNEHTIDNKNRTIADLMEELSKYTSNIELSGNVENVFKKIDGFRKDNDKTHAANERDRIARLLVGSADGRELRFPLFKNRLTIGRTSHNDIQLDAQCVSRRHAVISTDHGQTRVIDWGSKNGVFVNDVQVTERILKSGDTVSIGTAEFRYEERPKR